MILFINNTKNTFYETKVLMTKHVSFFKYIYNALLISNFSNFSGVFDFIIIQYGAAVEIQQRGHSGKALEKKKYGG
jgi:hypothetical protein